jgi:hypothetical protein
MHALIIDPPVAMSAQRHSRSDSDHLVTDPSQIERNLMIRLSYFYTNELPSPLPGPKSLLDFGGAAAILILSEQATSSRSDMNAKGTL